jgi:hypothetical protein
MAVRKIKSGSPAGLKAEKRRPKQRLKDLTDKTLSSERATSVKGGAKHIGDVKYGDSP